MLTINKITKIIEEQISKGRKIKVVDANIDLPANKRIEKTIIERRFSQDEIEPPRDRFKLIFPGDIEAVIWVDEIKCKIENSILTITSIQNHFISLSFYEEITTEIS